MRIAIFSDVHGNLEALQAVLAAADGAGCREFICLGDVVGYGPDPARCIELLQGRHIRTLRGNHDDAAAEDWPLWHFNRVAAAALMWTRQQLTEVQRGWLRNLQLVHIEPPWQSTFVHASLQQPENFIYVDSMGAAIECIQHTATTCCFVGHTHQPMMLAVGAGGAGPAELISVRLAPDTRYLFNVGSVGQPRDANWRSALVILDTETDTVEMRRVEYDIALTQQKMKKADLPDFLWKRLAAGM